MMECITIVNKKYKIKIALTNTKFIVGNNYEMKYRIINTLDNYFQRETDSEYAKDNNESSFILLDEEKLNISDFEYYHIDNSFNCISDMKISPKSLILKYMEEKINKLEFSEEFQSLQIIINSILDSINESIEEDFEDIKIRTDILFEKKQLLKLLIPKVFKEECEMNNYDLIEKDRIIIQLQMLNYIYKNIRKKVIILLECNMFYMEYIEYIKEFNKYVFLIIIINKSECKILDSDNIFMLNKDITIDLFDEQCLFDLCFNYKKDILIDEMRKKIMEKVNSQLCD